MKNDGNKIKSRRLHSMTESAMIAALYAAATLALAPISFGPLQIRLSEALTLLPTLLSSAIPGLAAGCAIANGIGAAMGVNLCGAADILFGSLATVLAALASRAVRNIKLRGLPILSALPPAVFNGFIVGGELAYAYKLPFWICASQVALGELIVTLVLGLPLYCMMKRLDFVNKKDSLH